VLPFTLRPWRRSGTFSVACHKPGSRHGRYSAVLDALRPILRNATAHLDPDSSPLSQDHWDDLDKAEQALPALRWIARQLLDAELQGTAVSA